MLVVEYKGEAYVSNDEPDAKPIRTQIAMWRVQRARHMLGFCSETT